MTGEQHPWTLRVRVDDVPESGLHLEASADAPTRAAVATLAGVDALTRFDVVLDIARRGRYGLRVVGELVAVVRQACVVTLEPIENKIREPMELVFVPPATAVPERPVSAEEEAVLTPEGEDPPEHLVDGTADLGRVATEYLVLAIDPYPRKADAVFEPPAAVEPPASPFDALAALKKDAT